MTFRTLADLVVEARAQLAHAPAHTAQYDAREFVARLALVTWGPDRVGAATTLVNVAGLAHAMRTALEVHELRADAIDLVHDTDVRTLPAEAPRLLRRPFLLEARAGARLFGDVVSLGGYELDGAWYLVAVLRPDGAAVWQWCPQWHEREVLGDYTPEASPLVGPDLLGTYTELAGDAVRFVVTLGMLLDAEGAPIRRGQEQRTEKATRKNPRPQSWTVRRVSLATPPTAHASAPGTGDGIEVDTSGRVLLPARVRGHVRMQAHGAGRSERRLVYVAEHSSRRWCAPTRRVVVTA